MSMDEYEDCFVWSAMVADSAEFRARWPWESFMACVGEMKDRGWRISRDQYGDWDHRCGRCKAKASADILDRPFGAEVQRVK